MKPLSDNPFLTLVGAGPGDPELISLKGIKALQTADVVLYDALVDESLLNYVPDEAEIHFVGKRIGSHRYSQDEINRLIVSYAFSHGHVVRLKGGDPFIFGRGHEELTYAKAFGVETQVIPGISSIASVPGLQSIPLTRRGINESFWVITGTTSNRKVSSDIYLAAKLGITAVVLMGMHNLSDIVNAFKHFGRGSTPVAIIQSGSTPEEKIGLGTIDTIQDVVEKEQLKAPAIILIGEVASLHPDYLREQVGALHNSVWHQA